MPSTAVYMVATAVVVIAIFAGYIAVFGIPKEYKRAMEEKALETMGEVRLPCFERIESQLTRLSEQGIILDKGHAQQGA